MASGFAKLLDQHGYGFQYSVLKRANELATSGESKWQPEASEFPTEVQDKPTHIDFLLSKGEKESNYILICECKRANSSLGNWCFAKSPFTRLHHKPTSVVADLLRRISDSSFVSSCPYPWAQQSDIYHLGLEVRTGKKGDSTESGRNAINEAVTQVLRGMNGLANIFGRNPQILKPNSQTILIPVVFTTATLWTSAVKLDSASLATGKLADSAPLTKTDWLIYDHNQSPGLKHSVMPAGALGSLNNILANQYARSICIVSWQGIDSFLTWSSNQQS